MSRHVFYRDGRVNHAEGPHAPRPNRLAAGMTFTLQRSRVIRVRYSHLPGAEAAVGDRSVVLTLATRGTLDPLAKAWAWAPNNITMAASCPCCGAQTDKRRLTDAGRRRLAHLKTRPAVIAARTSRPRLP